MAAAARRWLEDGSAIGEDVDGRRRCRDPRRCRWRRCRRFAPASPREWALRDGSVGCARRMRLNCSGDGFLPLRDVKLPDATNATADASISLDQCWQRFLMNCSCLAFSASSINRGESGCINFRQLLRRSRRTLQQKVYDVVVKQAALLKWQLRLQQQQAPPAVTKELDAPAAVRSGGVRQDLLPRDLADDGGAAARHMGHLRPYYEAIFHKL